MIENNEPLNQMWNTNNRIKKAWSSCPPKTEWFEQATEQKNELEIII